MFIVFFVLSCQVFEDAMVTQPLKNQENKGMCSFIEVKLEKQQLISSILFNKKYFLLCYGSSEHKTIVLKNKH